ncbi:hypothetical protein LPJ61_000944 [Coemansia biformis]|uniref:Velvet domain-containing protein n=1 Tax=Coemansia biformis TaxID=1286918 RepID=A0A9W7YHV9_9FUNG|nr:hypothetical protein LPJ61_000944 [Coemansia biformis]
MEDGDVMTTPMPPPLMLFWLQAQQLPASQSRMSDNLHLLCSAAAAEAAGSLRPIDPPPIVQLFVRDPADPLAQLAAASPAYFMQVQLLDESGKRTLRHIKGQEAAVMAGSMVSPLYALRDTSMTQGAYFVFSDLSVRLEGTFRLRFDLFEIKSTPLSRMFADQGLRIRIRTEAGTKKRGKKCAGHSPAKRARHSAEENVSPPLPPCLQVLPGATIRGFPGASVSCAPCGPLPAAGVAGSSVLGPAGMLVFQTDPFPAYGHNKENIPPPVQQAAGIGGVVRPGMGRRESEVAPLAAAGYRGDRPSDTMRLDSTLDLDDITAVALLDSLSSGTHGRGASSTESVTAWAHHYRRQPQPQRQLQPQLQHQSMGGYTFRDRQPEYAPMTSRDSDATISPVSPAAQLRSLPGLASVLGKPTSIFGRAPGFGVGMEIPLSNYRLSAVRGPERQTGTQSHDAAAFCAASCYSPQHHPHTPLHIGLRLDVPDEPQPTFAPHTWDPVPHGRGYADRLGMGDVPGISSISTDTSTAIGAGFGFGVGSSAAISAGSSAGAGASTAMHIPLALPVPGAFGPGRPPYEQWNGVLPAISTQLP